MTTRSLEARWCDPDLAWMVKEIMRLFERQNPGSHLIVTCTHRSSKDQYQLWRRGRHNGVVVEPHKVVTYLDGIKKKSKHNLKPAKAVDFAVVHYGKISWDSVLYEPIGPVVKQVSPRGLDWGGWWKKLKDYPHVELR